VDGRGHEEDIPPERRLGFEYWRALEVSHSYFDSKYYHQDETEPRTWAGYDAVAQTDDACRYILSEKKKPFCLFLSWGPPHDPYKAPPEYMERFADKEIRLRENVNDFDTAEKMWRECDTALPERFKEHRMRKFPTLNDRSNRDIIRWHRGYYAAVETLDDCLGNILDALEQSGQLDNSIVVFTSDHGDNLGSHRQVAKQLPFEESISIPFLVRYPKKIKAGSITDALFAPVDMMPTILSLAAAPCPEVDGKDISGAAMGSGVDPQDAVLLMKPIALGVNWIANGNGPWSGVRTKRYTYARKSDSRKPWMLYDNQEDPSQLKNLVDDLGHAKLRNQLDNRTTELLASAGEPEDPAVYAKLIQEERDKHGVYDRMHELMPACVEAGSGFGFVHRTDQTDRTDLSDLSDQRRR
jgi:arylsulfatase A-like enzyme